MLDKDKDTNSGSRTEEYSDFNPLTPNSEVILVDEEFEDSQSANDNDPLSSLDTQYKRSKVEERSSENFNDNNDNQVSEVSSTINSNNSKKNILKGIINEDEQENNNDEDEGWIGGSFNKSVNKNNDQGLSKEEKEKQIAELKKVVSSASTNNASENVNDELSPEGSILEKILPTSKKPKKAYNQRVLVVIGLIVITTIVFVISSSGRSTNNKQIKGSLPNPEEARTSGSDTIETAELAPAKTRYVPTPEETEPKAESLPPLEIPPNLPPMAIPPTAPKEEKEVEPEDFAVELRAGTAAALKSVKPPIEKADKTQEEVSLEGLSISMILLEPFRSGISTLVKAQVIRDVTNAQGEIIIPTSSRVQVPFEKFEVDGRVINDSQEAALVLLPNGKKLTLKGSVKGVDGFAGIKGKVKKLSKGNVFARVGKTFTRIGARVVGVTTGGFAGRGLEETINQSVDSNSDFTASGRIVEILPGTKFTFNVN